MTVIGLQVLGSKTIATARVDTLPEKGHWIDHRPSGIQGVVEVVEHRWSHHSAQGLPTVRVIVRPMPAAVFPVEGASEAARFLPDPLPKVPASGTIYRHKGRGTYYELLESATLQASSYWRTKEGAHLTVDGRQLDGEAMVVYRSMADETWWVRPRSEFFDGRFEVVPDQGGVTER